MIIRKHYPNIIPPFWQLVGAGTILLCLFLVVWLMAKFQQQPNPQPGPANDEKFHSLERADDRLQAQIHALTVQVDSMSSQVNRNTDLILQELYRQRR